MYSLSIQKVQSILFDHGLLREIISEKDWLFQITEPKQLNKKLTHLSFNSKEADADTLFFCKGVAFKPAYLEEAVKLGVNYYVSEKPYDMPPGALGIIVTDIRQAMALIAREFYDCPDKKLKMVGITGTKGKTTTTYFVHSILEKQESSKTAIISTMGVKLDGKNWEEAHLTTPESLDLFNMLAQAVENGMEQLVMEVSSQAFKMNRVYGLRYDIGVFLNISPDHIGPNEHPSMEDYFYCKRQLLSVSDLSIINSGSDHFTLLLEQAKHDSDRVMTYGTNVKTSDYTYSHTEASPKGFNIKASERDELEINGRYAIAIPGDFNKENALCAALIAGHLGTSQVAIKAGLAEAIIPGRMEHVAFNESSHVYVDFAHNYISLKSVLDFVVSEHPENDLVVVLGAPGGKGVSRRKDFGELLSDYSGHVILTADDPNEESPQLISEEIASYIKGDIGVEIILDREKAIKAALSKEPSNQLIVIAGKGNDAYMLINQKKEVYAGDMAIVKQSIS